MANFLNVASTKTKLAPHSLSYSRFFDFSLLFVDYVPNKVSKNLRIGKILSSGSWIAFGLPKKRLFSSENFNFHVKEDISLSYISKLGTRTYENPAIPESRELIRRDNKGKIGVYCWFNNVNDKYYIGSGDPLYVRLSDYYQDWYYLSRASTYIVRAISKHGMNKFSFPAGTSRSPLGRP
uniref:GIY-YIG endonuclease n=1 Tax=Cryphonectria parasitica TaxID=5116 RepID=A0A191MXI8_CRYPA|nr:GIY-YIG endonuclease [Cryphonectria parasitica]